MDWTFPTSHQDLFESYITNERSIIHEHSGDWDSDEEQLLEWARKYAAENGLELDEQRLF